MKAKAHRRVKSGVPDQVAQNSLKMPMVMQQYNNNPQGPRKVHPESQMPSSGQRSLKSINKQHKKVHQNCMLIYEEHTGEHSSNNNEFEPRKTSGDEIMLYNSNQHDSRGNKVINVSFNDFNQSLDNANIENSIEHEAELIKNNNHHAQQIKQIHSSNKNLNNFLEALQKIKPQNPVVKQGQ